MIGVLVLDEARGEDDARPHAAQHASQRDGVSRPDLEVGVSIELDEFDRGAEQRGGSLRFSDPLLGPAVRRRLAARAHDKVRRTPGASLERDHSAAAELDVIGMRPEGEHRRRIRRGVRRRLHRTDR